jgi:hypothetical protein
MIRVIGVNGTYSATLQNELTPLVSGLVFRRVLPKTPEQLAAYLQRDVDLSRMQKFLNSIPASVTTLEQLKAKH